MPYKIAVVVDDDYSVARALEMRGNEVVTIDADAMLTHELHIENPDVIVSALDGARAASGGLQQIADILNIPIAGSPFIAYRIVCDRAGLASEMSWQYQGQEGVAHVSARMVLTQQAVMDFGVGDVVDMIADLMPGFPLAVKPTRSDCDLRAVKVETLEELCDAIDRVCECADEALVEEWVDGVTMDVCVLGTGEGVYALPPVEVVRLDDEKRERFAPVRPESLAPDAADAEAIRSEVEHAALDVHEAFGACDLARVRIVWDGARCNVIGIDLSPSQAPDGSLQAALDAAGLSLGAVFDELVDRAATRY